MAAVLSIVGALLVVAGVAFIYWPAAFVTGGVIALGFAAILDLADAPDEVIE